LGAAAVEFCGLGWLRLRRGQGM